jgi:hypothetical protein
MKTVRVKVKNLKGIALDWAVAKCEGLPIVLNPMGFDDSVQQSGYWVWYDGLGQAPSQMIGVDYSPSKISLEGAVIMEREKINIEYDGDDVLASDGMSIHMYGSSSFVAAMRVYVCTKMGVEIDVPAKIMKK